MTFDDIIDATGHGRADATPEHTLPKTAQAAQSLTIRYRSYLSLAPGTLELIGDGVLTNKPVSPPSSPSGTDSTGQDFKSNELLVKFATDFSYSADQYAGNGFGIKRDAGCKS